MSRHYFSKTKYGNKKTEYNGVLYDSKFEAEYAQQLDFRIRAKDIESYQRQVPYILKVNNKKICKYIMDFLIQHKDGSTELVEIKGFETDVWKLKKKLFEATILLENKDIKYTIIKR